MAVRRKEIRTEGAGNVRLKIIGCALLEKRAHLVFLRVRDRGDNSSSAL